MCDYKEAILSVTKEPKYSEKKMYIGRGLSIVICLFSQQSVNIGFFIEVFRRTQCMRKTIFCCWIFTWKLIALTIQVRCSSCFTLYAKQKVEQNHFHQIGIKIRWIRNAMFVNVWPCCWENCNIFIKCSQYTKFTVLPFAVVPFSPLVVCVIFKFTHFNFCREGNYHNV